MDIGVAQKTAYLGSNSTTGGLPEGASPGTPGTPTLQSARKAESATDSAISRDELDEAVASMQSFVQSVRRDLDFHVDDSSGRVVVQVIASDSGDVIRQIPSEEALELAARLDDARSLLFREQA
ncbi:flagellar protein FlaG [Stutzerimonas kirkiae]|uniref:Flagellar protein FlaG n=1 Tax=Stutzerimonas kirkiae TaxID=2211392 RepID=A0A4Q9REE6_9GAMM|nr:flagellar protein FlaG [Stutzerimonas kirkiae]TBU99960.1 hypothetical protein DNJ96_01330 [Stutzerimonas kirkiae]TBV05666.1 hypothetical protein DNJ95_02000 [Stutzerimonas kirkiae]TBV10592.1 hypothetical protein DNK08_06060 [Stutzerimonas kirkiae]TBV17448.1 hypothetical protein DNK01_00885 [Stutzerimonas kirkiae]